MVGKPFSFLLAAQITKITRLDANRKTMVPAATATIIRFSSANRVCTQPEGAVDRDNAAR